MFAGFMTATALDLRGDRAGAEAAAKEAVVLGDEAGEGARARTYLAAILFRVRRDAGRLDEVVEVLQRARSGELADQHLRPALSLALAELGRFDELDEFRRDAAEGFAGHHRNGLWLSSMCMSAEVAGYAGRARGGGPALSSARALRRRSSSGRASVPTARSPALSRWSPTALGRFDEADRLLRRGRRPIADRFEAPVWLARAQQEWAAMLLVATDPATVSGPIGCWPTPPRRRNGLDLPIIAARVEALQDGAG